MNDSRRSSSAAPARRSAGPWPLFLLPLLAGCSQEDAAIFGKALFGLMIVSFIVIPLVFLRAWSAGKSRKNRKDGA